MVDLAEATRQSKAALHARRAEPGVKAGKKAIVEKHASRKYGSGHPRDVFPRDSDTPKTSRGKTTQLAPSHTPADQQLGFDF
jgi:deoxyribodipyrimidine photo-lyase